VLVFGSIGLALSACAAPGPGAIYANGYYDYPGYYDPGYVDSFGFVGRDRGRDRRHDHDEGGRHGMHDGDYGMHDGVPGARIAHGPSPVAGSSFSPHSGFGGEHGFDGGRSFGGERGGGRR
jgi:hypothetical protein